MIGILDTVDRSRFAPRRAWGYNAQAVSIHPAQPSQTSWRVSLPLLTFLGLGMIALLLLARVQPLWAVLLCAAGGSAVIVWRWPWALPALMLAFTPLYDGIARYLTWIAQWPAGQLQLISLWKEGGLLLTAMVLLALHLAGKRRLTMRFYAFDLWLAAWLLLALLYIVVAARPGIGIYGLRNYVVPLAFFYLARMMGYTRREWLLSVTLLLAVGAGVAAFGIYQARALDFPAMMALGYQDGSGTIPYAFRTALRDGFPIPRAVSTTTGPNQFAVYLNYLLLVCLFGIMHLRRALPRLLLGALALLYGVTLLLTLSRGGLLAFLTALAAWAGLLVMQHGVRRSWRELRQNRLLLGGLILLLVLGTAGVIQSGFATRVLRGLTGRDPAADAHQSSMAYSIDFIAARPLGIGMGMVGERALQFAAEAHIEHTESTFFQTAMELGWLGLLLQALVFAALLQTLWRLRQQRLARGDVLGRVLAELALIFWLGALADFVFTPLLQNLLAAGYLWWAAGVAVSGVRVANA